MRRLWAPFLVLALVFAAAGAAAESGITLSVGVGPVLSLPLGEWTASQLTPGGGGTVAFQVSTTGKVALCGGLDLEYTYAPLRGEDSLSLLHGALTGGLRIRLAPRLGVGPDVTVGWYQSVIIERGTTSGHVTLGGGAGLDFLATRWLDLGARVAYRADLGLAHLFELSLGAKFYLWGGAARQRILDAARPEAGILPPRPGRGLRIRNLIVDELFPVFHAYYDDHPIGSLTLENLESEPIEGAKLTFLVPQYMSSPQETPLPDTIPAGARVQTALYALLVNSVLEVTEATKIAAELDLEYTVGGVRYGESTVVSLRVLQRNALTWDDDRKAAAFVTAGDTSVLTLAKTAAGAVRGSAPEALDPKLLEAMALFSALDLLGVSYVVDPNSSFEQLSQTDTVVDFVQFPRETLSYRAGDCDDLTVLYAAMLESVGIESAFVTTPGHIFPAFATDLTPREVSSAFSTPQDVIVADGKVWIPVEATARGAGFVNAWSLGARAWRDASARDAAVLIPVHAAWQVYEPVQLPGSAEVPIPPAEDVLRAVLAEMTTLTRRELKDRLSRIDSDMSQAGQTPRLLNRRGILYARYGLLDEATRDFEKASLQDHVPATVNLGNVYAIRKDWDAALACYERASGLAPNEPSVLVGLARGYQATGRAEPAARVLAALSRVDPALAAEYGRPADTASGDRGSLRQESAVWAE